MTHQTHSAKKRNSRALPTQAMIKRCAAVAEELGKTILVTRQGVVIVDQVIVGDKVEKNVDVGDFGHL